MVLLRGSALDVRGSPAGCWAAAQLVLLFECFVFCRAGFFLEEYGNVVLVQGRAAQPGEDSAGVTLGKSPLLGVGSHPSSPLSHVPVCWGED